MKICVLMNPQAGPSTSNDHFQQALVESECVLRDLKPDDDWNAVVVDALRGGFEMIAVAGGDGTVHGIINSILKANGRTTIGIVPLGTGNDLCRTLAIPFDPAEAIALLRSGRARSIDAIRASGDLDCFLANAATGGFSGEVASEVTSDQKATWGPFAYLRGAVGPLTNLPQFRLTVQFDDSRPETVEALNIVIANGRSAAGGVLVAPAANPEDGLLDVVIVHSGESLDLALLGSRLMHGNYVDDDNVVHRRAKRVAVEADSPMKFSMDGELREGRRFVFEIVPRALRIVVGPDYSPVSVQDPPIEDETGLESAAVPKSTRERYFGLMIGLLLVLKRIRSGPGLYVLGTTLVLVVSAWLAQGVVADEWRELNQSVFRASRLHASETMDRFALGITWLGGPWGTPLAVTTLMILFIRARHYLMAGTVLATVFGVLLIEAVLKPAFGLARPTNSTLAFETGYSFPSGHALRGVGIYGLLAAFCVGRALRSPLWWIAALLCAATAVGICWSRIYLGVHWLTDVVMGGLLASAWVSICLIARHQVERRSKTPPMEPR
jgi:diacylglycerol kinase (ATP)